MPNAKRVRWQAPNPATSRQRRENSAKAFLYLAFGA